MNCFDPLYYLARFFGHPQPWGFPSPTITTGERRKECKACKRDSKRQPRLSALEVAYQALARVATHDERGAYPNERADETATRCDA